MKHIPNDILSNNGLYYIHKERHGRVSELENKLGKLKVRQLEAMGYIKNAPNPIGNTWMISKRAERMAKSIYRDSTRREKLADWFNRKVRKIDFSI